MKSAFISFLTSATIFLSISSCEKPTEFSSVPVISFQSVQFLKGFHVDTLNLTIGFEDNEGDLWASPGSNDGPFVIFPRDTNGNLITLGSSDTLPLFNLCDYMIYPYINGALIEDTVYMQMDSNYNNIFFTFFIKERGVFRKLDFRKESGPIINCNSLDGRILRLNAQAQNKPLQGSLTYSMVSFVFGRAIQLTDTLQIQVSVRDNAFNRSAPIMTPEFTLQSARAN